MRFVFFIAVSLALSASVMPAGAQPAPPARADVSPSRLWLEAALWLGPYTWIARSTWVSTGSEPEPDEVQQQRWTMIGGAVGFSVGARVAKHAALGSTLRFGLAAAIDASWQQRVDVGYSFSPEFSVLIAQQRTRGVRLLMSGGPGILVSPNTLSLGLSTGLELGYAFPVGRHAIALGAGCDLFYGGLPGPSDQGYYKNRDYLIMPGVTLRYVL